MQFTIYKEDLFTSMLDANFIVSYILMQPVPSSSMMAEILGPWVTCITIFFFIPTYKKYIFRT